MTLWAILIARCYLYQSLTTTTFFIRWSSQQQVPARRSNIPGQLYYYNTNYSNVIQNHPLHDWECLVCGSLDDKPITILIDTGSSISLLDEQLYRSLSFVPPLQPTQLLVQLQMTGLLLHFAFQVQLVVTRNIVFPVVLGINFLQRHVGIISFPTKQLYLTNSSPKTVDKAINANRIYNTYIPAMHIPKPYHPHSRITFTPKPYHVINTEPVTIPARTNTIMTIPCTLPRSWNYLSEPSAQHFVDQPVHCTPVTMLQMTTYPSTLLMVVTA